MKARGLVLVGLCLIGAAVQVRAEDVMQFSGTLQGSYSDYNAPFAHLGIFDANGAALFTVNNPGFDFQADFNNVNVSAANHSGDGWSAGGDIFWRDYAGAIGVNASSHSIPGGSDYVNYDGFGQWFILPEATLEAKGGWLTNHYQGPFGSGGIVAYPMNQLALDLTADYAKANHLGPELKDIGLSAEFQPLPEIPASFSISYTRARMDRLPIGVNGVTDRNTDIFGASVKIYFGGGGESNTLRDYQRNGPIYWDGTPATLIEMGY